MKFKELEKLLKKAGWTLYSTRGSHFYYVVDCIINLNKK